MPLENGHGKIVVFTSVFPILHRSIYIVPNWYTRRSQSVTFFNLQCEERNKEQSRTRTKSMFSEKKTYSNYIS